jgi:hypothetical protein
MKKLFFSRHGILCVVLVVGCDAVWQLFPSETLGSTSESKYSRRENLKSRQECYCPRAMRNPPVSGSGWSAAPAHRASSYSKHTELQ